MGYYLKWSDSTGNKDTNTELLEISGLVGQVTTIVFTVKEPATSYSENRYFYDFRRQQASTSSGGDSTYFLQFGSTSTDDGPGSDSFKINGSSVSKSDFFSSYVADDELSAGVNATPSNGTFAFGARYNEVEHNYGLTVSSITVTDGNGAHTIDMSDSGGTGTSVTSTDSALTATLYNFPGDDSQWVFYSTGADNALTATDIESASNVSSPGITQAHSLTSSAIESASSVSAPSLTQAHSLASSGIESASSVSAPSLAQNHSLSVSDVESANTVSTPSLTISGVDHVLGVTDIESAASVSAPIITQVHGLTVSATESAITVSAPAITQAHTLTSAPIESAATLSSPSVSPFNEDAVIPTVMPTVKSQTVVKLNRCNLDVIVAEGSNATTRMRFENVNISETG